MSMTVGILAFQGNVAEHASVLGALKQDVREVRTIEDLRGIAHLILPGGESTVIGRFLKLWGLDKEIVSRARAGDLALFGTCAGAILLSKKILGHNNPESLDLLDIDIDRNAYGTQRDSFEAALAVKGIPKPVPVAFIRAPKIVRIGKGIETLAKVGNDPVLVRQGRILASACHPEARGETAIHRLFLTM